MKTFKTMVSYIGYFLRDADEVKKLCEEAGIDTSISGGLVYFHQGEKGDTRGLPISGKKLVIDAIKEFMSQNTETPEEREVFESMSVAIAKCADWPDQGESVTTPVGKGEFLTKVYTKGETLYVVQFENTFSTFPIEAIKPIDTGYEAGKKLRELWLSLRIIDTPEQPFDKVGSGIRKAWIELAKHVKPIDEEAK